MIKFNNGKTLPKLGLGTFLMTNDQETKDVIKEAYKIGYRHFDTAQMYQNEHVIGEALKELNVKREDYYITTKLKMHHSKEETRKLIDESLSKLKTDYIDLLLIHWPNHDPNVNISTYEVMEEYYKLGKIKSIGVSNFTRYQLEELIPNIEIMPVVNQVEFHPLLSQEQMFNYLNKHNIKLMGYGPLARGKVFEGKLKEHLEIIAQKHNTDIASVVIAWGLHKGAIMIPKTVTKSRLITNFKAKELKLDSNDITTIDKLNDGRRQYSDPSNNVYGKLV